MFRAIALVMMLTGCVAIGPTDPIDADVAPPGTFRLPHDEDRFGARLGPKVEELAQSLARRYGRFGSPEGVVMSPDERVIVIAVRDHPSTCLCDRERGVRDAGSMVAVVERSSEHEPKVTRLFERGGMDPTVAVSRRHVAVAEYTRLRIWSRADLATPEEHRLSIYTKRLFWTDDGARLVAITDTEVEVVDAEAGFVERARWKVPGFIRGAALQDSDVLVLHVMPIVTPGEWWIPYRLDGRIARAV